MREVLLEYRTSPVGNSRKRPANAGMLGSLGGAITAALLVDGLYTKNVVGPRNLHGGAGLPTSSTLPLGSSTAGASIGKLVWFNLSLSFGPAVQAEVTGWAGS